MLRGHRRKWLWLFSFMAISIVRVYIGSLQNIYAVTNAEYDELLFLRHSTEILTGHWLGNYNYLTLIKLPVYPLWLALVRYLALDIVIAQHALYVISCLIFVAAIYPKVRNYGLLLLIYLVLIFNPAFLSSQILDRVLRCGIYPSLTLIVFSSYLALYYYTGKYRISLLWAVLGGMSLTLLWLSREESLWISPFIFVISIIIVVRGFSKYGLKTVWLVVLPLCFLVIGIFSLKTINKIYYQRPITVELKDEHFIKFYNALRSISVEQRRIITPAPREARYKAYDVSPAFRKVRAHLEGDILDKWYRIFSDICRRYRSDPIFKARFDKFYGYTLNPFYRDFSSPEGLICHKKDYYGGWFIWGLLDSLDASGFYENGLKTCSFYERVYNDILLAMKTGKLKRQKIPETLLPRIRLCNLGDLLYNSYLCTRKVISFRGIVSKPLECTGPEWNKKLFAALLKTKTLRRPWVDTRFNCCVLKVFKKAMPAVLFLCCVGLVCTLLSKKSHSWELIIGAAMCLVILGCRVAVVVLFDYYYAPGLGIRYLSPCYSILIPFLSLGILAIRDNLYGRRLQSSSSDTLS